MKKCLNCGETTKRTYCGTTCQQKHYSDLFLIDWLMRQRVGWTGKTKDLSNYVRRFVRAVYGTACSLCGWDERHPVDQAVLTEIDHIDGDADNSWFENLRVLCPNCHSMTPTFRARNRTSARER